MKHLHYFSILILLLFFFGCHPSKKKNEYILESLFLISGANCNAKLSKTQNNRIFTTSFESQNDFTPSYIVPVNYQNAATHSLDSGVQRTGTFSHKGTIYAKGPSCGSFQNCNHRAYPTIQLHKMSQGSFRTPVLA